MSRVRTRSVQCSVRNPILVELGLRHHVVELRTRDIEFHGVGFLLRPLSLFDELSGVVTCHYRDRPYLHCHKTFLFFLLCCLSIDAWNDAIVRVNREKNKSICFAHAKSVEKSSQASPSRLSFFVMVIRAQKRLYLCAKPCFLPARAQIQPFLRSSRASPLFALERRKRERRNAPLSRR